MSETHEIDEGEELWEKLRSDSQKEVLEKARRLIGSREMTVDEFDEAVTWAYENPHLSRHLQRVLGHIVFASEG